MLREAQGPLSPTVCVRQLEPGGQCGGSEPGEAADRVAGLSPDTREPVT